MTETKWPHEDEPQAAAVAAVQRWRVLKFVPHGEPATADGDEEEIWLASDAWLDCGPRDGTQYGPPEPDQLGEIGGAGRYLMLELDDDEIRLIGRMRVVEIATVTQYKYVDRDVGMVAEGRPA